MPIALEFVLCQRFGIEQWQEYQRCAREILQHLTQHIDVTDSKVRSVGREVISPGKYKTQQDTLCETLEQWDSRLLTWVWCVLREYLQVCCFVSSVHEAYWTYIFIFMNRMADFVLQDSYCSSWPMEWHAGRFLCSNFNMQSSILIKLLTAWQCTEILLYSIMWGVGRFVDSLKDCTLCTHIEVCTLYTYNSLHPVHI